jgi:acyl-CoA synthetase (AMP-forming)/AMP-acid ligase II
MIITGGFNVYPAEVEQVALGFDGVQDCAAVGVPDEKWGEAVTLVVQPKTGHTIDPQMLLLFCREHLGGVKAPKSIQIWTDLPRSPVGKVLKREIRQQFWQHTDRNI